MDVVVEATPSVLYERDTGRESGRKRELSIEKALFIDVEKWQRSMKALQSPSLVLPLHNGTV